MAKCQGVLTGIETLWEFGPNVHLLAEDGGLRRWKRKLVKYSKPFESSRLDRSKYHSLDQKDLDVGKIVDVLLVQPTPAIWYDKNISGCNSEYTDHNIRALQMVIVGRNQETFQAVPIKTYNNLGTAASGVIKGHHTNIHISDQEPTLTVAEHPYQLPNGVWESSVLDFSLRAHPSVEGWELSNLARLDLSDTYWINFGVQTIRAIGEIDERDVVLLNEMCRIVSQNVKDMADAAPNSDEAKRTIGIPVPAIRPAQIVCESSRSKDDGKDEDDGSNGTKEL